MVDTWLKFFKEFHDGNSRMLYKNEATTFHQYKIQRKSTSKLVAQDVFVSLKHHKAAPTDAFPIFRDHLNAVCRMKMQRRYQRIENSTESAKSKPLDSMNY